MPREIKFRAWEKKEKRILYFTLDGLQISSDIPYIIELNVMQYTGLKDKNGIEIYEGDIVKDDFDRFVIIFENGGFVASKGDEFDRSKYRTVKINELCEVIGNIYENPELLKVETN